MLGENDKINLTAIFFSSSKSSSNAGFWLRIEEVGLKKLKSNSTTTDSDQAKNRNWYIPIGNHYSLNESVVSE
jgi:hypothetical protein